MRVAAVVGSAKSGKTTLMARLICHFVQRGERVGAIKHTHHPINDRVAGDTARLSEAGAAPVILAGDREAVIFRGSESERVGYADPDELLARFDTDIVLIEGFKDVRRWPRIELDGHRPLTLDEALTMLDNG